LLDVVIQKMSIFVNKIFAYEKMGSFNTCWSLLTSILFNLV
jgi:hypothetical protein